MTKKVIGVCNTEAEVREMVRRLELAGLYPEEITLIAKNSNDSTWLRNETDLDTTTIDELETRDDDEVKDTSFWEKVKDIFTTDSSSYYDKEGFTERFNKYGLNDEEIAQYDKEIQQGKTIVLIPERYIAMNRTSVVGGSPSDTETKRKEESTFLDYDIAYVPKSEKKYADSPERKEKREWDIRKHEDRFH